MSTLDQIPDVFKEYVNCPLTENVEIIEFTTPVTLTREEALHDFNMLRYIMENAYSGREYWENNGVDFAEAYDTILDFINSREKISRRDLRKMYCTALKDIHDWHLSFLSYGEWFRFGKNFRAYFSDVLLEKSGDRFVVILTRTPIVAVGDSFTSGQLDNKVFRTLSPAGREHYLLGCRSWETISHLDVTSDRGTLSLPLHPCRASQCRVEDTGIVSLASVEGFPVVTSSRFNEMGDEKHPDAIMQELYDCGRSLRQEEVVIWNLLGNGGGLSDYPKRFIAGLNEYATWIKNWAELMSPPISSVLGVPIEQIQPTREWSLHPTQERCDTSQGVFEGVLYLLTNDGVASSGEAAISISRSVRNCITIGQNSLGMCTTGNALPYQLPFSGMQLLVPHRLFLGEAREGEGYEPDFWVDSADVQGELISWLMNPDTYQALR